MVAIGHEEFFLFCKKINHAWTIAAIDHHEPRHFTFQHGVSYRIALSQAKRTAAGPDEIPFCIWKDYGDVFTPVITTIRNDSLRIQYGQPSAEKPTYNPHQK